ncbi:phenoloxidase-activating enzyme-like [Cydia splendana]|uniref:phenoloxidase-activating enzyme-like n=1 Tax=Cydia splendana TaxID=1100963 RepID=UPI00300C8CD0
MLLLMLLMLPRLQCYGPAGYSVCCTPAPPLKPIQPTSQIDSVSEQCPATALPPGPETACCGSSEGFNKISGGGNANIDQFPWLVLIEYRKNNTIVTNCGGALISGKYVLTAAHCVDTGNTLTSVRLGEYDTYNSGPDCVLVEGGGKDCTYGAVSIPVERIIRHPYYQDFVRPICLPSTNISESSAGSRLLAAGWGAVDENRNESPVKQIVDLPPVDILTCYNHFSKFTHQPRLWGGQMCAGGEPGKDACAGDSGGPLIRQNEDWYEVVGIVSYGTKPCGRLPGVYTNVYAYLDWIRSNMNE